MRMVFVHGFTQTARSWDAVIRALPAEVDAIALNVPDGLDLVATAHALGELGESATYVGYSMGGRLCLHLALDRPELVERLALVSASPGIPDDVARAARRDADEALAGELERDGIDRFLDRWLAQPLFATLSRAAAGLDDRRVGNTVARLTHQLRVLGQGAQEPLWGRLHSLEMPVTLVAGMLDVRYVEIAEAVSARIAGARVVLMEGAGHALPLERPAELAHLLTS